MAEHEEQRAPSSSLVWPSRDSCRQSQQRPTLCAVAGPNGSGKTTTTELLLANEWGANSLYINPDNIAEQEFGGWNNVEAVLKAAYIYDNSIENHLPQLLYRTTDGNLAKQYVADIPEWAQILI